MNIADDRPKPAYRYFPDLVAAERRTYRLIAWDADKPGYMKPGWKEYQDKVRAAFAEEAAIREKLRGILCAHCEGHGVRVVSDRRKPCKRCGGDGWTLKGRRKHTTTTAA